MPVTEWKDRRGKVRLYVSRQWPDGSRFRRVMPNRTVAKKTQARIEEAIAMGTWPNLKSELEKGKPEIENPTIKEFSKTYLEEFCRTRNRRPDFKEETLDVISRIVGNVRVKDFKKSDATRFVTIRSGENVKPATVNRGLAVLRHMLSYAVEKELILVQPLKKFRMLPEPERALRLPTEDDVEQLLKAGYEYDCVVGALLEVLVETGLRLSEALALTWSGVDLEARRLTVEFTKSGRVRHIPLTERAVAAFRSLVRFIKEPHVFVRSNGKPIKDPRGALHAARKALGMDWVGFHTLRHFRCSQWVKYGMPMNDVQRYMGHESIQTTMIYVHVDESAWETARRIETAEAASRRGWPQTGRPAQGQE